MFIKKTLDSGTMVKIYLWISILDDMLELDVDKVTTDIIANAKITKKGNINLINKNRFLNR